MNKKYKQLREWLKKIKAKYVVLSLVSILSIFSIVPIVNNIKKQEKSHAASWNITDVKAKNRRTVEVYYDEALEYAGAYRIEYEDEDGDTIKKTVGNSSTTIKDDESIIKLNLSWDLDPDTYYTLYQGSKARDLSGNTAEKLDDGFQFVGNGTPKDQSYADGVKLFNGLNAEAVAADHEFNSALYNYYVTLASNKTSAGAIAVDSTVVTSKKASFKMKPYNAFRILGGGKDDDYAIIEVRIADDVVTWSSEFDGIVDTWNMTFNSATEIFVDGLDLGSGSDVKEMEVYKNGVLLTEGATNDYTVNAQMETITFMAPLTQEVVDAATGNITTPGDKITVVVYNGTGVVVTNGLVEYVSVGTYR